MSRTNRILLPLLLIPLTLGEMAGQDPPPWDPTLTGTTIDAGTGRPIPGVALHLVPAETGVASPPPTVTDFPLRAISDAEGRFVIEAARPGRYRLAPVLDGYVYARPEHLEAPVAPGLVLQIEPRQPMDGLEVALVPEAIITGQVFRPNGSPHSNTRVRLFRNGYDDEGRQTPVDVPGVSSVRTDDRGEYRFFGLQPGEYYIGSYGTTDWPGTTYFPGTTDASRARPVSVEAGNEARVPTMTVVERESNGTETAVTSELRVRFGNMPSQTWFGSTSITFTGGPTRREFFRVVAPGGGGDEMTIQVSPGSHEALAIWPGPDGLAYSRMRFDLGTEPLLLDVVSDGPPMRTSGRILMEEDGELTDAIGVSCRLRTASYTSPSNCIDAALVPGDYRIELSDLPRDAWVVSAAASGADFLTGDVPIEGNVEIEVVLARPGGIVEGVTAGEAGTPLSGAVVALVPDTPLRESGLFYRSAVTDVNGRYRLEGVAPGSYRLYAWTELEGAAYRNAEFMTAYESEGTPVALEGPETITLDITAF